jgi:predicted dehydrogenase
MIGVGVIGYGYWGPNVVRNFNEASGSRVVAVSDLCPERLIQGRSRYPLVKMTPDYRHLITDTTIDAIIIATPPTTHFDLALEALQAGKHVLVEKPFTETSEQAKRLIDEACRRNRVLMVDHTFVYTGAVRKIRELVVNDGLGEIYYYDSVRVNLGLFQHDASVIWDLAVHDLSIMDYILNLEPVAVSATGMSHVSGEPEDVAYLTLFFDGHLIGHVHVNWLAPVKVRRTLIGASCKMIVYDDLEPSEKVKVYDKGITLDNGEEKYRMLVGYRTGDMWAPQLDATEALRTEIDHFLHCIEQGEPPITGGEAGLRVVRLLEAATQSVVHHGRPVEINHCAPREGVGLSRKPGNVG